MHGHGMSETYHFAIFDIHKPRKVMRLETCQNRHNSQDCNFRHFSNIFPRCSNAKCWGFRNSCCIPFINIYWKLLFQERQDVRYYEQTSLNHIPFLFIGTRCQIWTQLSLSLSHMKLAEFQLFERLVAISPTRRRRKLCLKASQDIWC